MTKYSMAETDVEDSFPLISFADGGLKSFKYNVHRGVIFPPFSVLFVCKEAKAHNDPGFRLLATPTDHFRPDITARKGLVSAHKTEITGKNCPGQCG